MKKITTFLVFTFALVSYKANAQNNLSFSKVKLITATDTVPVGKVWKIESVGRSGSTSYPPSSNSITINNNRNLEFNPVNVLQNVGSPTSYGGIGYGTGTQLPFWVPAGTIITVGQNSSIISVIEYNIVQ